MISKLKRLIMGSFAVILMVTSLAAALPNPLASAQTQTDKDRLSRELCIFPSISTSDNSPDYHIPNGWLSIEIINRAVFKLTFDPTGQTCANDRSRPIQYIDGETPTKPLLEGSFYDENTSDNTWNYRNRAGGAQKDDSTIDEFQDSRVPDGPFGGQNRILGVDDIRRFLSEKNGSQGGAEYTIGIEESRLPVECRSGDDNDNGDNFQLVDELRDGTDFVWRCSGGGLRDDARGYRIADANNVSRVFDGKLERFNITYNYTGEIITHVSTGVGLKEFRPCPGRQNKFYQNCAAGGKYIDITKEALDARLGEGARSVNPIYGDIVVELPMKDTGSNEVETVAVAGVNSISLQETTGASEQNQTGNNNSGTAPDLGISCDVSILNPLTWLFCPIIEAAAEVVDQLDNAIVKELNVNTDEQFGDYANPFAEDASNAFYRVWANFRTLGLIVLVIAALVMVISQAVGAGPFDAYTVKKVMPRILIAIIFMTLSWDLCIFLINITNDFSLALRTMIQSPFQSLGGAQIGGVQSSIAGSLLAGYAGLGLGIIGLLSFVGTALLAVFIAFFVLILRKVAIIFLVLVAPFAIACYILPNTKKGWDFWWDTFSKALLMFPIIMGLIAVGRSFAAVTTQSTNSGSLLSQIVILLAYFGPYFALPFAFRLAGGAIANIAGIANDRGRGAFDRLKKFRQDRAGDRIKKFRAGGFYNENTRRGKFGNKLGTWAFNADEMVPHTLGKHGVPGFTGAHTRLDAQIRHEKEQQSREAAQRMNERAINDQGARVISGAVRIGDEEDGGFSASVHDALWQRFGTTDKDGNRVWKGLQSEKDWDDAAAIMATSDRVSERHASDALLAFKGDGLNLQRSGKGYTDLGAAAGLIVASHGFMNEDDLVTVGRSIEGRGGSAFASTMMTQMEVNGANSGLKVTYSHSRDDKGKIITGTQAGRGWDRALSKGYSEIASQKKHAVKSDVGQLVEVIQFGSMDAASRQQLADEWVSSGTYSRDQANSRLENAVLKKDAALDTLQKIIAYNPGATDTVTVVNEAFEKLGRAGVQIPGQPDQQAGTNPGLIRGAQGGKPSGTAAPRVEGSPRVQRPPDIGSPRI